MTELPVSRLRNAVLVAYEPPSSEHLGIRLVAAGLAAAGFEPQVLSLVSPSQLEATVAKTLAAQPILVGVSITDPLVAPLLLAFARLLRKQGYAGHITAGGALATLQRAELLASHAAIDSVVRHAGEAAIVALANAICDGRDLSQVPGLSTRTGEGSGNAYAFTATRLQPLRAAEPPTLIGIPKAAVAASRGCAGHCAYCGVAALEHDLAKERQLLGLDLGSPRGVVRRAVDDLADEVADLYHQRGVRIVQLMDDNVLGPDPHQARSWLGDLEAALRERRVGKMAWRLMAEPSVLSDDVVDALARLGVLSVLVGVESLTAQGKSALGRRGRRNTDHAALQRLASRGIVPVLNVLALRPDGGIADAHAELSGLADLDDFAWDVLPVAVWPGTTLADDLAKRGLLVGRGTGLAWRPAEPEAERFLFALNRLRMGGLAWVARQPNPVDVLFALRVASHLGLPGASQKANDDASRLLAQAQRVRRSVLDQALALAASPLSPREFGQAVEALAGHAENRLSPFDQRFADLLDQVSWPDTDADAPTPARRLASHWLAHGLVMAMATSCGSSAGQHDAATQQDSSAQIILPEAGTIPDAPFTSKPDVRPLLLDSSCSLDGAQAGSSDSSCDMDRLASAVDNYAGTHCLPGPDYGDIRYAVVIDCDGRAIDLLSMPDQTSFTGAARQAWLDAVANDRWPCLAGQAVQFSCYVSLILTP